MLDQINNVIQSSGYANDASSPFKYPKNIIGYQGLDIPSEYLVTIICRRPVTYVSSQKGVSPILIIKAPLQEEVITETESRWSNLTSAGVVRDLFNELAQATTDKSLVSKWSSRRVWSGSSPLSFTLNLKFEAVNDTESEVISPIKELLRLTMPYMDEMKWIDNLLPQKMAEKVRPFVASSFLLPPGPSPFSEIKKEVGEIITVKIGKYMKIARVVVPKVSVKTPIRMERGGNVIGAVVTVHFETFEMPTKETFNDMFDKTAVSDIVEEEQSAFNTGLAAF